MLTIFLIFLLLFYASYTLAKNSDFWYNENMKYAIGGLLVVFIILNYLAWLQGRV